MKILTGNSTFVLQGDEELELNLFSSQDFYFIHYSLITIVSPGQVSSHRVIRASDEGGRVCARRVRLRCHGKRPQSNSPQQLEHKHTQEHRLGGEEGEERRMKPSQHQGHNNKDFVFQING